MKRLLNKEIIMPKMGNNCCVKGNVIFGKNVTLGNNVTIYDNVIIGDNVYIWDNVVIGKLPMGVSSNFKVLNSNQAEVQIGNNCVIACNAVIYAGAKIESDCLISENSIIRENVHIQHDVIIGGNSLIQYDVHIGNRTRILNNSIVSSKSIIGNNNFISWGFTTVSDKTFGEEGYNSNVIGPTIGDNNFIGPNVTVLSNLSIGNKNMIGACSLITKAIGDNGVYFGAPAKFIRNH